MSDIKASLTQAMKEAMRAKDKPRLGVIRMALAALKQQEVDTRETLDDTQVLATLDKMVKQRRDSAQQYQDAGREELQAIELAEIEVLQDFLPQALTPDEIAELIRSAVEQTGASSTGDMGKVMGILKPQLQGRADMGAVSGQVKAALA